jgi:hypothetical protein
MIPRAVVKVVGIQGDDLYSKELMQDRIGYANGL